RYQPELIIGLGGYASAPVLAAARLAAVPVVIQEQNAFPGVVNRCFAPLVDAVFTAFDEAGRRLRGRRVINCGNPVRRDFLAAGDGTGETAPTAPDDRLSLLVVGGSQGARSLNRTVPPAVARLQAEGLSLRVTHQAGSREREKVQQLYAEAGVAATVADFFPEMPRLYRDAELVICRAGALTLAELALVGKPAVLVPYPHAAHNHQEYNARVFADRGAAVMVREAEMRPDSFAALLADLCRDGDRRRRMGRAARELARPRAAAEIVDHCLEIVAAGRTEGKK
ncbi:MAG: UDP-N-acetylglucosamine--N-acetylmuramyl-(pentapeptide) pyrophosphoryl-undecaprenol N-acetylglucosamine transferase, partial [Deltaproteobacteria bacterium]|nr:UDP-N-acetylglucosamine--N-acetylmuramyl-(pentapeptide) pyrophosphoryl-undecaprenol N-acetylglucosamine transferase [Deltaproteobacteria bacterium]